MLDFINFLVDTNDGCGGLVPIVKLIYEAIKILMILIPIGLIVFGLIDLGKAVIAGKEDEMKKAQGTLIKRVLYAALVFFIPFIVGLVMDLVAKSGGNDVSNTNDWSECWNTVRGSNNSGNGAGE